MFSDIKSYENEINYLKQKKESLKNEMKLQQEGYSKQIQNLLEDLSKLRSINNSNETQNKNINSNSNSSSNSLVNSKINKIDDSAIEEDSLSQNMSVFTSTAEFVKTKTITIPSHDSAPVYVIEAENVNESIRKLDKSNDQFEFETKRKVKNVAITEHKPDSQNLKLIDNLNHELEKVKLEKNNIENQMVKLHEEIKNYQNDNLSLASKYEQKLTSINEQLKILQNENMKLVTDNNDLRLLQTKNNTELAQIMYI